MESIEALNWLRDYKLARERVGFLSARLFNYTYGSKNWIATEKEMNEQALIAVNLEAEFMEKLLK